MPNWAFSYALALYRLSESESQPTTYDNCIHDEDRKFTFAQRAEQALLEALTRFPMVLPRLLTLNNVNTQDRSFRMDWPSILPYFNVESMGNGRMSTVEERVAKASGEHLVRIFVLKCYKLWGENDVMQWLYHASEKITQHQHHDVLSQIESFEPMNRLDLESEKKAEPSGITGSADHEKNPLDFANNLETSNGQHQSASVAEPRVDTGSTTSKQAFNLTYAFSAALARYAQFDPSEYEDAFRTLPPEAIALDPNIVAPAMALDPNRRGRLLRGGRPRAAVEEVGGLPLDAGLMDGLRGILGINAGGGGSQEVEMLDPDSPLIQLYLQSLLPWAQVEGVRPPPRG